MKKKYRLFSLSLFLLFSVLLPAQTLEQAKALFAQKQYEKSQTDIPKIHEKRTEKHKLQLLVWRLLLKTGDVKESVDYLKVAVEKNIQNAPLFLGEAYSELWYFDEAVKCYNIYITTLKQKKETTDDVEKLSEKCKLYARMLKGVEDVCVVDSFVVDKKKLLEVYKISEESGKLYAYKDFFPAGSGNSEATVHETELGNVIYYSEQGEDNTLNIYTQIKTQDEWSAAMPLPDMINHAANTNYPFMLTDGTTIYYASDGSASLGGYDIFVTRYNSDTKSYLTPENVGMPFNSSFNDYMYVIDEYNNVGWFASDRYQPDDKVCVYVFVPNKFKKTYNYELTAHEDIVALAQLRSLQKTWKDEDVIAEAQRNLEKVLNQKPKENKKIFDFEFVINDQKTYYTLDEFKSSRARETFNQYRQLETEHWQLSDKLASLRDQYASSSADKAKQMQLTPGILDLEKRVDQMQNELDRLAIKVRYEEKNMIKK